MKANINNKISPSLQQGLDTSKLPEIHCIANLDQSIHFTNYMLLSIKINLVSMLFFHKVGWFQT